ncbi:hypothetical protein LRO84_17480 [Acinetobacter calcoaceticus]|nr:hypothetical protein [Acinetobacter calcoaceticus]UGQ31741.1 hypothetical protein LRO84_17480 [Acinetobacter calcoaceticus]
MAQSEVIQSSHLIKALSYQR